MPSSTSNSKPRLILQALAVCGLVLAGYQVIVSAHVVPPSDGIDMWEDNRVRAEHYLYDRGPSTPIALVGSSLTANLKASYFDQPIENLGFHGGDGLTGLDIIRRSGSKPSVVVVEVDETLDRGVDKPFVDGLFQQPLYSARRKVTMLRQEYQPASVLVCAVKNRAKRGRASSDDAPKGGPVEDKLHALLISHILATDRKPLSPIEVDKCRRACDELGKVVDALKGDGSRVVLMEIPGEVEVGASPRQMALRTLTHECLPEGRFEWLASPPARTWRTADGVHLIKPDAKFFAAYVESRLQPGVAQK